MLKKIVKFGSTTEIIMDQAVFELLGIVEGSAVQLQTDGKSLIITPLNTESAQAKLSQTLDEYYLNKFQWTNVSKNSADAIERGEKLKALNEKYAHLNEKFLAISKDPEYKAALELLQKEHETTGNHADFDRKSTELISRYIPEYETFQEEFAAIRNGLYEKKQ